MSFINVNQLDMYYEIHGRGEPVVFIAGFGSDHTVWSPVVELFKDRYQVIVFDNRGAGQTDVPLGPYSIEQMADDVAGLCEALGVRKAHFIGNSMGGFILQTLASRHPTLIKSAVLGNTAANIHTCFHIYVDAQLELLKASAPLASVIKASCSWAFSYQFLTQPGMLDNLIQLTLNSPYPFTIKGYEGQYAALSQFDSRAWLADIAVPTLVLTGDEDLICSHASGQYLADTIPHARRHCFKTCGHLPQLEYPEAYSTLVQAFIAECE